MDERERQHLEWAQQADPGWGAYWWRRIPHDWRNHVPPYIRDVWQTLDVPVRLLIVRWADELADAEEWE